MQSDGPCALLFFLFLFSFPRWSNDLFTVCRYDCFDVCFTLIE